MGDYRAAGKEVLEQGLHFADARTEAGAKQIADAMNAMIAHRSRPYAEPFGYAVARPARKPCSIERQGDEYACACGARWDASEGEEHP